MRAALLAGPARWPLAVLLLLLVIAAAMAWSSVAWPGDAAGESLLVGPIRWSVRAVA